MNSTWIFDGVLVDFNKKVKDEGFSLLAIDTDKKIKKDFWQWVALMAKNGQSFWRDMDPMVDAFLLWNYIKKYSPEILSATGHVGNAAQEKKDWVKKHLGNVTTHLVRTSVDKAQYAAPNHILIDDREKSIGPWVAAGGIGILHKNAIDTIQHLKLYGL